MSPVIRPQPDAKTLDLWIEADREELRRYLSEKPEFESFRQLVWRLLGEDQKEA